MAEANLDKLQAAALKALIRGESPQDLVRTLEGRLDRNAAQQIIDRASTEFDNQKNNGDLDALHAPHQMHALEDMVRGVDRESIADRLRKHVDGQTARLILDKATADFENLKTSGGLYDFEMELLKNGTRGSASESSYDAFPRAITNCFQKYAIFKGRAVRSEFWYFHFLFWLVTGLLNAFANAFNTTGGEIIAFSVWLAFLLPSIAVTCRRLHDVGRSGWWLLLIFTLLGVPLIYYWLVKPGQNWANAYGDPASVPMA
jgi:uncharacterized membrane protein YhaH (DUF805 family)